MKINILIIIIISLIFFACNKDEEGKKEIEVTTSSISGRVALYDDGNVKLESDDMIIKVEGTSPELFAISNMNGEFKIDSIPFGSYTISFNKVGYGIYKSFDVSLTSTGEPYEFSEIINLGQISNTTTTNKFRIEVTPSAVDFRGTVDPEGTMEAPKYLRLFYSNSENVSSTDYISYSEKYAISEFYFEISVSKEELTEMGFVSDSEVYMKVYGESYWSNEYEDKTTGKMVFPNLNTNSIDAVSFILP